jgi:hypothetical protein
MPKSFFLLFTVVFFSCNIKEEIKPVTENKLPTVIDTNPYVKDDQSDMDMSWWPANYPIQKMQGLPNIKLMARIIYSRPFIKGRKIFGTDSTNLCMYGRQWRLGANEATEIDFFEDVMINQKKVSKGVYTMYCIPQEKYWTIILNTELYTWGLHINEAKDIFKVDVLTQNQQPKIEHFTMIFNETKIGADLIMAWDNVKAVLPITLAN